MSVAASSHPDGPERLQLVADSLPFLVWTSGADRRCNYFNQRWRDFTGRDLEAELRDCCAGVIHSADLQRCRDTYARAFDRREPYLIEYRLRRHDGEYRWILNHAAPLSGAGDSFAGYLGACFDVTDFRRAEAERTVSGHPLRLAMEAGKSVGWERDVKTDRSTWFGDLSMFGMPANIHVGHGDDFRTLVHPDDREMVSRRINDALESGSPYATEFRLLWANGTIRWLSAGGRFYYSPEGEPERTLGIAVDITDRKAVEESLRRKDRELEEAQRLAGVGSWHWDLHTGKVVWSRELYRIAGRDPALPAVSYEDHPGLYPGESWDRLRVAVEIAVRTGAPYEVVLRMLRTDGTHRWVTARGEAVRDSAGDIAGLRGTVQDITDRKLADEAVSGLNGRLIEAQESERARIARDLHDDIGQRLASVAMAQSRLKRMLPERLSGGAAASLAALQKQTGELIADVQALSHDLHPPRLLYLGLVEAIRGLCDELARQKNVRIDFGVETDPGSVPHDVSLCLFRVLQEALSNAVRHSGVRRVEVRLRGAGGAVDLRVRDEGVGFDLGAAQRGLGLGLTSMKERLKLVGGELFIESQPNSGTTVLARAPIQASHPLGERPSAADAPVMPDDRDLDW